MKFLRVCLVMSGLTLLLASEKRLQTNLIVPSLDSYNYLAHATSLAFGEFPNYDNEYAENGPFNHAIGPALLALPFVYGFSWVDRLQGAEVVNRRTLKSLHESWTAFGFAFATQFYLLSGMLLAFLTLRDGFGFSRPALTVLLGVLACGLPLYAYWSPVSTHVYEFTLVSAALFTMTEVSNRRSWTLSHVRIVRLAVALAVLTFLVRYNNVLLGMGLGAGILWAYRKEHGWPAERFWTAVFLVAAATLVTVWATYTLARLTLPVPGTVDNWKGSLWNEWTVKDRLLVLRSPIFYLERIPHILFARDMGAIFTAPLLLIGLAGLRLAPRRRLIAFALLPLAVNLYMIVAWGTHGSFYGYRYFVYAALPFSLIGLAAWWDFGTRTLRDRTAAIGILTFFATAQWVLFDSARPFKQSYGATKWAPGWVKAHYVTNVLDALILHPVSFAEMLLKNSARPLAFGGEPVLLVKTALLVAMPVIFGLGWMYFERVLHRRIPGPPAVPPADDRAPRSPA